MDIDIQCLVCLSKNTEINIPVKLNNNFKFSCNCGETMTNNNIFCKTCIEDWLEPYNYKTGHPSCFISTRKCLLCRQNLKNNFKLDDIITIDLDIINKLDYINNNITCPRCNIKIIGRLNLNEHLINECPKNVIECNNCNLFYNYTNKKKHIRQDKKCVNNIKKFCNICHNNISLFEFNIHINNCPEQLLQCTMCDDIFKKNILNEHICENNKLKKKILILKETNKNLITYNQDQVFKFKIQILRFKSLFKDNAFIIPSIDELHNDINEIINFSNMTIDINLYKNSEYINIPRYNKYLI